MPRNGWSYLVVTRGPETPRLQALDGGSFASEKEMLDELGATGWELCFVRDAGERLVYYFKRPRT